jgi:hypothetical protein
VHISTVTMQRKEFRVKDTTMLNSKDVRIQTRRHITFILQTRCILFSDSHSLTSYHARKPEAQLSSKFITPRHPHNEFMRITDRSIAHIETTRSARSGPLVLDLLGTTQETRPPRRNKTGLLTLCCLARDGGCFTDMLVVTTSVGMVDGVHGYTTSLGPAVALGGELKNQVRILLYHQRSLSYLVLSS